MIKGCNLGVRCPLSFKMSSLAQSVDRHGHNILSPPHHPSFKIALPNLCRLFPPGGFGQKKTPGAFIALESLSTAAISLSLLPRRSDGVGCTDVIN